MFFLYNYKCLFQIAMDCFLFALLKTLLWVEKYIQDVKFENIKTIFYSILNVISVRCEIMFSHIDSMLADVCAYTSVAHDALGLIFYCSGISGLSLLKHDCSSNLAYIECNHDARFYLSRFLQSWESHCLSRL